MPTKETSAGSEPGSGHGADHDRHSDIDYDLDATVDVESPEQLKAVADETRRVILDLLLDRAATTSQLADALDKPKGTVGYHLKVLEDNGLVRVVRTAKVRALTEKYYGRTGRTFVIKGDYGGGGSIPMLAEALAEARRPEGSALPMATLRHIRIPDERAVEFADRLFELSNEFASQPRGGDTVFGLVAAVYPTDRPRFRDTTGGDLKDDG